MDFASLMSKEISKAKDPPSSSSQKDAEKKYVRRGEAEAARVAAYNENQEKLQREREERMTQKRKFEDEEAEKRRDRDEKKRRLAEESRLRREEQEDVKERERRRRLGLPEVPAKEEDDAAEGEEDIPDEELDGKFRELDEPVRLFGEGRRDRLRRYRESVDKSVTQQKMTDGPIPTTLEPVPEVEMKISKTFPKDSESRQFLYRQLASFFNMLFTEWELALAKRDSSVKESFPGRQAYSAMVQSRENMKPLFRNIEKSELADDVLRPIIEIVHQAQKRRYVDANDAYLRLSIGKAYVSTPAAIIILTRQCMADRCRHGRYPRAFFPGQTVSRR